MPYKIVEVKIEGYKYQNASYIPIEKYKLKYVGKKISDKEIKELTESLYKETLNIKNEEDLETYLNNILFELKLNTGIILKILIEILLKRGFN